MAFFNLDSSKLRDDTMSVLSDVVKQIKAQKLGSKINIIGHTCSIGTDDYNQTLSEARAKAAHDFFVAQGIDGETSLCLR
jgi:OOP family OmpA-OmpF porin